MSPCAQILARPLLKPRFLLYHHRQIEFIAMFFTTKETAEYLQTGKRTGTVNTGDSKRKF